MSSVGYKGSNNKKMGKDKTSIEKYPNLHTHTTLEICSFGCLTDVLNKPDKRGKDGPLSFILYCIGENPYIASPTTLH